MAQPKRFRQTKLNLRLLLICHKTIVVDSLCDLRIAVARTTSPGKV
jgi:hypothetical protein